jgi:hypothetical protein
MDSIRTVGRWSKLSRDMSRDRHCQPCAARIQPSGPRIRIRNAGDWGADMYRDRRSGSGHMYMYESVPCPKYTTSLIRPAIQNHLHPPFSLSSLTPISDAIHGEGERLRPAARCRSLPPERSLASTGRGARRPYPRRRSSTRRLVFPVPVPMGTTEVVNPSAA